MGMDTLENGSPEEVMKKFYSILRKTSDEFSLDNILLSDHAINVIDTARKYGYVTLESYCPEPRVFLWGVEYADENFIYQQQDLVEIFKNIMKNGDILLKCGNGPEELDLKKQNYAGFLDVLQDYFVKNNIRFMYNDDAGLIDGQFFNGVKQKELCNTGGFNSYDPEVVESIREYIELLKKRDKFICKNPSTGIIPLYHQTNHGTAKLSPYASIHQIVGVAHLN